MERWAAGQAVKGLPKELGLYPEGCDDRGVDSGFLGDFPVTGLANRRDSVMWFSPEGHQLGVGEEDRAAR